MRSIVIRFLVVLVFMALVYGVCDFLLVPSLQISALAGWGLSCLLFSYEWSGRRRIMRQGFEDRSWLERGWIAAGAACLCGVVLVIFFYM